MNQEQVLAWAREACAPNQTFNSDEEWVKRFAALVASHEREKCAKTCETDELCCKCGDECAEAIRARGDK